MIVQYPQMPTSKDLKIKRPMVYLIGSFDGLNPSWYRRAARMAEERVGSVFYGIFGGGDPAPFVQWTWTWIDEADLVVMWLEHHDWAQMEFGYILGRARSGEAQLPLIGVHPDLDPARHVLELTLGAIGFEPRIHTDLEELVHEAGEVARRAR